MKTVRARPGDYRNEAVFRSAERLIASQPSAHPSAGPRWSLFAAGTGLGLVLALAIVLRVTRAPVPIGSAVITSRLAPEPAAAEKSPPTPRAASAASGTLSTPGPTPSDLAQPIPPETSPAVAAAETVRLRSRALPPPLETPNVSAAIRDGAYLNALFATLSDVTLRGEMRAANWPALGLEFNLRRFGDSKEIAGRVDFFQSGQRVASRRVQGTLDGRTLVLREIGSSGPTFGSIPFGHRFGFVLPEKDAAAEIPGDWAVAGLKGTATLRVGLPW